MKKLTLLSLQCLRQEDNTGLDGCLIAISVDGINQNPLKKRMKTINYYQINATESTFENHMNGIVLGK